MPVKKNKTKKELQDEIKQLLTKIESIERSEKYGVAANEVRAIYNSFIESGFSDEQSFDLTKLLVSKVHF